MKLAESCSDELFGRHWNVATDIFGVLRYVIYPVWLRKAASQYCNWLFVLVYLWLLMVYNITESLRIDCRVCKSSLKDFYGLLANLIYYMSYLLWTKLELKLMGQWGFYEITKSMSATDQKYTGKSCRASKACLDLWVDYLKVPSGNIVLERHFLFRLLRFCLRIV